MSRFWKAGPRVKELLGDYTAQRTDEEKREIAQRVEFLTGNRLNFICHYKGNDLFLETPEDIELINCTEVTQGQFLELLT